MGVTEGMSLKVDGRVDEHDIILYLGQPELTNIPVKGWIIDPDAGLLNSPCDVVHLPTHYREVVHTAVMLACS